jgi:hypothetical protein
LGYGAPVDFEQKWSPAASCAARPAPGVLAGAPRYASSAYPECLTLSAPSSERVEGGAESCLLNRRNRIRRCPAT